MNGLRLLICVALLWLTGVASAEEFSGKVIAVIDGDTLLVLRGGRPVKVRLAEIDAPEKAQPFGIAAQKSLAEMVKSEKVKVVCNAADDYGRLVGRVYVGEFNVNSEQVRRGMAWEYSHFHSNRELVALQQDAQRSGRGLWAEKGAIEPAQWRKLHQTAPAVGVLPAAGRIEPLPEGGCARKACSQMASCDEARDYVRRCGARLLDGDGDGVPCEKLCAAGLVRGAGP